MAEKEGMPRLNVPGMSQLTDQDEIDRAGRGTPGGYAILAGSGVGLGVDDHGAKHPLVSVLFAFPCPCGVEGHGFQELRVDLDLECAGKLQDTLKGYLENPEVLRYIADGIDRHIADGTGKDHG